jgi:hypothetical protein
MAVKVGSFAKTTAAATASQSVTGVGFKPRALILWTDGVATGAGAWGDSQRMAFGVTAGPDNSFAIAVASRDAVTRTDTTRHSNTSALAIVQWSESLLAECGLTSFDNDGFTLSWTTNNATAYLINYLAISGSEIDDAKVVQWNRLDNTGDESVTGVGFKPDLVIHLSQLYTSATGTANNAVFILGAMDAEGNQWSVSIDSRDNLTSVSNTAKWHSNAACLLWGFSGSNGVRATYKSMDADGFTVNFDLFDVAARRYNASLCLKGTALRCGNMTMPVSDGAQAVSGLGFGPLGVLLATNQSTSVSAAAQDHATLALGASDGTNQRALAVKDEDNLATSDVNAITYNDRVIVESDDTGQDIVRSASVSALGSDGFTLNWSDSGAANYLYWLAFGATAARGHYAYII